MIRCQWFSNGSRCKCITCKNCNTRKRSQAAGTPAINCSFPREALISESSRSVPSQPTVTLNLKCHLSELIYPNTGLSLNVYVPFSHLDSDTLEWLPGPKVLHQADLSDLFRLRVTSTIIGAIPILS